MALWWTLFGDPSRADPFREATKHLTEPPGPSARPSDRLPFEIDAEGWTTALGLDDGLSDVTSEMIPWTARLDPGQLRALYATMIGVRRRSPPEQ